MDCALQIADGLILALKPDQHVRQCFPDWVAAIAVEASVAHGANPIQQIEDFCTRLSLACEASNHVMILTGANEDMDITVASLLLGSFLILRRGLSVGTVLETFRDSGLIDLFVPLSTPGDLQVIAVPDCWRALGHALRLGWFVPPSSDDEPLLDARELAHYASAANGGVQVVVPGALLLFPTPSDVMPDGQEWADSVSPDGRTTRRFSAGFCASLLVDLGVSAAACLGRSSPASARAFAVRGVAPSDLRLPTPLHEAAGGASSTAAGALLPALDRLLTLARGSQGAVAVHSGSIRNWRRSALGVIAAAFLISRFGFSGAEAAAWAHLVAC